MPFLHCISSFEGTCYKKLQVTDTNSFISCCYASTFTLADVIFHILKVYSIAYSNVYSN